MLGNKEKKDKKRILKIMVTTIKILLVVWAVTILILILLGMLGEALALFSPVLVLLIFSNKMDINDYLFAIWWDTGKK